MLTERGVCYWETIIGVFGLTNVTFTPVFFCDSLFVKNPNG